MTKIGEFRFRVVLALAAILALGLAAVRPVDAADLYFLSEVRFSGNTPQSGNVTIGLCRLGDSQLKEITITDTAPRNPAFVISDNEMRLVAIGGSATMPSEFDLMSMDSPGALRKFQINVPRKIVGPAFLAADPSRGSLLLFKLFNDDALSVPTVETMMALDIAAGRWLEALPEMYRYLRITGGTGGTEFPDYLRMRQFDSGQLVIPIAQQVFPLGPPLPPTMRIPPKGWPYLLLNNPSFMVVAQNLRTQSAYRILDKRDNNWTSLEMPGDSSWYVRAFGSWMAGIVDEDLTGKPFRLSPGRQKDLERNPVETVDQHLETQQLYRTGKLFLYQVAQRRYYEWDTQNGDCEVLLVENNQVYYRVDEAIYRATIGDRQLGKPELLVQDAAVPGIHWAFFGPSGHW